MLACLSFFLTRALGFNRQARLHVQEFPLWILAPTFSLFFLFYPKNKYPNFSKIWSPLHSSGVLSQNHLSFLVLSATPLAPGPFSYKRDWASLCLQTTLCPPYLTASHHLLSLFSVWRQQMIFFVSSLGLSFTLLARWQKALNTSSLLCLSQDLSPGSRLNSQWHVALLTSPSLQSSLHLPSGLLLCPCSLPSSLWSLGLFPYFFILSLKLCPQGRGLSALLFGHMLHAASAQGPAGGTHRGVLKLRASERFVWLADCVQRLCDGAGVGLAAIHAASHLLS